MLREFDIALTEFALKQVYNPFRYLMFWSKEVIRGKEAAATIEKSQQDLLNKYRSEKTSDAIEKDQSILGHLVRSPYASDKERCADMTTLMIAGQDTTSYTLAWIFLEISRNPAVLTQLKKEIDSAVDEEEEHITQRQLNSMVYLDQVIKEGMRLWPASGLAILRHTSKVIEYGDFIIPKGSVCQICAYASGRVGIKVESLQLSVGIHNFSILSSNNVSNFSLPLIISNLIYYLHCNLHILLLLFGSSLSVILHRSLPHFPSSLQPSASSVQSSLHYYITSPLPSPLLTGP